MEELRGGQFIRYFFFSLILLILGGTTYNFYHSVAGISVTPLEPIKQQMQRDGTCQNNFFVYCIGTVNGTVMTGSVYSREKIQNLKKN